MATLLKSQTPESFETFRQQYVFARRGPFSEFQAKFNLIIALTDLKNLPKVQSLTEQVCKTHHQQGLTHAEYRMLFPPWVEEAHLTQLISAICQGCQQVEEETGFQGRFSLSLPRGEGCWDRYHQLRQVMAADSVVAKITTSVDFCFAEEGFPPKDKEALFQSILEDNRKSPEAALAILYHVGESFGDKSLESAIRWVHQAAEFGAHRLGHAICLGIPPKNVLGKQITEPVEERLDQIDYDLQHASELAAVGVMIDVTALEEERSTLQQASVSQVISTYDELRVFDLEKRQRYVAGILNEKQVCIECCPTSNLRIGMIDNPADHPLHQFLQWQVPLVIGSDDPGIFDTTLSNEIAWIQKHILQATEYLTTLASNAKHFRSEFVSGRFLRTSA